MDHWQVLSLTPTADERSIKRAYARLLKTHRPDDNPGAFQRLREAYEASLAEVRWSANADEAIVDLPLTESAPAPQGSLTEQVPSLADPVDNVDSSTPPPAQSLGQMLHWLADGKEKQVLDALRDWLASDWLISFESRQQFEQDVLAWLERAPHWLPAFFDGVCQIMGWDENKGTLPCEYWRWDRLIRRCEVQAVEAKVRCELARFDAEKIHGQAAALLLKPMSDSDRRAMADYFTSLDWQRFSQLAQDIEYQYPEVPQRLGLQPLNNWRDWLPATDYAGVYLFLWLALSALLVVSLLADSSNSSGWDTTVLMPLFMMAVVGGGMKAYQMWAFAVVRVGRLDVLLSRWLLPRGWYRQGAGLLVLRHILPSAIPAVVAYAWSDPAMWLQWASPVIVFSGAVYYTNAALSGKPTLPVRAIRAVKLKVGRWPWHLFQREGFVVLVTIAVMAGWVYWRMKPLV